MINILKSDIINKCLHILQEYSLHVVCVCVCVCVCACIYLFYISDFVLRFYVILCLDCSLFPDSRKKSHFVFNCSSGFVFFKVTSKLGVCLDFFFLNNDPNS